MGAAPRICLNMIVRNEAHIIHELFDSVAPFISSWVIVDTGSDDGTQDVIEKNMVSLGIAGELHERPWKNFGHNRSEALSLARGHGDYIWVMDADDVLVGQPDFSNLSADVYSMRYRMGPSWSFWRRQLFRDGLPWYYAGVVHEVPRVDAEVVHARLDGDYHVEYRSCGGRSKDAQKFERDRDLLLVEVGRHPADSRSVFYLAQTYFDMGDVVNARAWYARRVEMGGWDEEIYYSMLRIAESMAALNEPWTEIQDAYLRAWEFRPNRAEALHAIAVKYRTDNRFQLGHLFAQRAASIPFPDQDVLFVNAAVHTWSARDEQSICASWMGNHSEAIALCRDILTQRGVPEADRQRITRNRDFSVPAMLDAASVYPAALARQIVLGKGDFGVTASLVAGSDLNATEHALNSFLNCCADVSKIGRVLMICDGMSAESYETLTDRYCFLEPLRFPHGARLPQIRERVTTRFWLHLGSGWRFFAVDNYVSRLSAVLEHEPEVFQVGINFQDSTTLSGVCAADDVLRRKPDTGGYVIADHVSTGPSMFDTFRLDWAGVLDSFDRDMPEQPHQQTYGGAARTATLDEVLCIEHL